MRPPARVSSASPPPAPGSPEGFPRGCFGPPACVPSTHCTGSARRGSPANGRGPPGPPCAGPAASEGGSGPGRGARPGRPARSVGRRTGIPGEGCPHEPGAPRGDVPGAAPLPRGPRPRRPSRAAPLGPVTTAGPDAMRRRSAAAALRETPRRVLVIGGSSEIATAIAFELVGEGAREIVLAGRDAAALGRAGATLLAAGAERVETVMVDAARTFGHAAALRSAAEILGGIDVAILAIGVLGERGGLPDDIPAAIEVLRVNTVGAGSPLMATARLLRQQRSGTLVVLSSVASERPRAANAVYRASKAGLDALAQALDDQLSAEGGHVRVVRPGFGRTRVTAGLPEAPLATTSQAAAQATLRGVGRRART